MNYLLGIDISHWQGEFDWAKAKAAGARFAYIRAGSINSETGICYKDYQFDRNIEMGPSFLPCGAYFFSRPKYSGGKQADYFNELILGKKLLLPPWADCEVAGATYAIVRSNTKSFVQNIDPKPDIYTRVSYWDSVIGVQPWAEMFKSALARYSNILTHPWSDSYHESEQWSLEDVRWWQWSADGNGRGAEFGATGSKSIDLDRFMGTEAEFNKLVGVEEDPEPLPNPNPGEMELRVAVLEDNVSRIDDTIFSMQKLFTQLGDI